MPILGRARARRICQAAIGALIAAKITAYDLVKNEAGDAFDRWFPDKITPGTRKPSFIGYRQCDARLDAEDADRQR